MQTNLMMCLQAAMICNIATAMFCLLFNREQSWDKFLWHTWHFTQSKTGKDWLSSHGYHLLASVCSLLSMLLIHGCLRAYSVGRLQVRFTKEEMYACCMYVYMTTILMFFM
jgi:hypothetical protein